MTDLVPLSEAELTAQKLRDMAADLIREAETLEEAYGIKPEPKKKNGFDYRSLLSKNKKKPN